MLNFVRAPLGKVIAPVGHRLARAGVTPDALTIFGTLAATASALIFFTRGAFFVGAIVVAVFVLFDMLDGAVARAAGTSSPFGAVLDSSGDRIADSAIFGSLAWWFARHDHPALLAAALLCLVLGSLTSYVKARAEGVGLTANVGIAERSERLIIVLLTTGLAGEPIGWPFVQAAGLWLLVAASTITVGQRLVTVRKQAHRSPV